MSQTPALFIEPNLCVGFPPVKGCNPKALDTLLSGSTFMLVLTAYLQASFEMGWQELTARALNALATGIQTPDQIELLFIFQGQAQAIPFKNLMKGNETAESFIGVGFSEQFNALDNGFIQVGFAQAQNLGASNYNSRETSEPSFSYRISFDVPAKLNNVQRMYARSATRVLLEKLIRSFYNPFPYLLLDGNSFNERQTESVNELNFSYIILR
jgi:hypothetical protein